MCHYIVRSASNVFNPPPFTGMESLGFAPPQRSENARFCSKFTYYFVRQWSENAAFRSAAEERNQVTPRL